MNQPCFQGDSRITTFFEKQMKYRSGARLISFDIAELLQQRDVKIVRDYAVSYFGNGVEINGTTLFYSSPHTLSQGGSALEQHYFNETGDFL